MGTQTLNDILIEPGSVSKKTISEFPGWLVVRTQHPRCHGLGSSLVMKMRFCKPSWKGLSGRKQVLNKEHSRV